MNLDTICVHGSGNNPDYTGSLSVPIYQTATFAHKGVGESTGYDYSRVQNPTREKLEELIGTLEGGAGAAAFSSGMAAFSAMTALFSPGDHLIVSDDLYGGVVRYFHTIAAKNGIEFDFVNTSHLPEIAANIKPNTKAIYVETPTNPMLQVTDIAACAALAGEHGLLLAVDNTFLTPYLQKPLALGADIVLHSGTKFLGGHNDTLAGFLVTRSEELIEKIRFISKTVGSMLAPFDAWLLIRGIKTLAVRMDKIEENTRKIAHFLLNCKKVKKVYYTGFENHPEFAISKSQARGFGGVISFEVDSRETAEHILNHVKLIYFAESLGGTDSLITYPFLQTHADVPAAVRDKKGINDKLLRLSIGIENAEDLIQDLEQAFSMGGRE
ncbi:MAG: PLP-dependent aspartate aminotransferase family protein [Fibrobacter sp.]|jgi:cystathionine beta-lyase/cystathionine gamma-synthase|nr:PLP-dependent aspartate aminotransferase family protein [Fibrobacter sp.]